MPWLSLIRIVNLGFVTIFFDKTTKKFFVKYRDGRMKRIFTGSIKNTKDIAEKEVP